MFEFIKRLWNGTPIEEEFKYCDSCGGKGFWKSGHYTYDSKTGQPVRNAEWACSKCENVLIDDRSTGYRYWLNR
jgi:hypothetical protein